LLRSFSLFLLTAAGLPSLGGTLKQNGWQGGQVFVTLTGVLLFEPLFISILKGQDSALLLLGGLLWFSGLSRNDDRLAGLGLALTLIRPQIALMLGLPFLFRIRRVFCWFLLGVVILGLYSFLQIGWTGMADYFYILKLSAGGEGYGMSESAMFNFSGLFLRLSPRIDPSLIHVMGWGVYTASLVSLCVLWGRSKSIGVYHIMLAVSLSLFAAPHLHYHDLALLAVPLVGLGIAGVTAGRITLWHAAALPMAVSVIFLFSEFWDPARFTFPYLLMLVIPLVTRSVENKDLN
jgi:hypothetical protein